MLGRWDPFSEMSRLQDEMSRWSGDRRGGFVPPVDIYEDKEAIFVKAELPGVKVDDVHISVENNLLTIRGDRKLEREEKKDNYHRIERTYGSFTRSFTLPSTVQTDQIDADMKDGILTLRLPKRAEAQPRRISVKGS